MKRMTEGKPLRLILLFALPLLLGNLLQQLYNVANVAIVGKRFIQVKNQIKPNSRPLFRRGRFLF